MRRRDGLPIPVRWVFVCPQWRLREDLGRTISKWRCNLEIAYWQARDNSCDFANGNVIWAGEYL